MKTYTQRHRDGVDPIGLIRDARKSGNLVEAQRLIHEAVRKADGKVSSVLADQMALLQMAGEHWEPARDIFLLIAAKFPDQANVWRNAAQCSEILGEYEAAKECYRKAVEAFASSPNKTDEARAYFGYGSQLFRLGDPVNGEHWWRLGLEKDVTSVDGKYQRSQILLALGDYENGWREYEVRKQLRGYTDGLNARGGVPNLPEWDGKRMGQVHLMMSQGAGDVIQFARYIPEIVRRSQNKVHLEAGEPLRRFLPYERMGPSDFVMHLDSAPLLLGMAEPIGPAVRFDDWRPPENERPRIGVCWKGSPKHLNDKDRSCPFNFTDNLRDHRWDLISLTNGVSFAPRDYRETAELMRTLDAVVTIDSSVLHVAGTLGVPTIAIPPACPEWRWGLPNPKGEAQSTPWYPSVTLIHRRDVYDWSATLDRAKQRLTEML